MSTLITLYFLPYFFIPLLSLLFDRYFCLMSFLDSSFTY